MGGGVPLAALLAGAAGEAELGLHQAGDLGPFGHLALFAQVF